MNINIKSIPAFKNISEVSLLDIENNTEILKFSMGQPICAEDVIPNKILIILSGQARSLHRLKSGGPKTIEKLKADSFIGLISLLRVESCEYITASTDIMALALSEKIVLKLYQQDLEFRKWCDNKLHSTEVYKTASILNKKNSIDENLSEIQYQSFLKNIEIISTNNSQDLIMDSQFEYILASANVINKDLGDLIKSTDKLNTRGPLPARIFKIPKNIYGEFLQPDQPKVIDQGVNEKREFPDINIKDGPEILESTIEKIGQYNPNKQFKLISATGDIRESLACLKMISSELNLPYREDAIEKILRDTIRRGKKPTIQLLGGITSMMGLHSSLAKVEPKMANRLPTPSVITWDKSFAVVVESNSNTLVIASPSQGIIKLNNKDFEKSFTKGHIDLLFLEKNEQTPESKFGLQWLLPAINRYRGVLLQVLIASFVVQLFGLANPLMIQVIIDKVISQRSLDTLQILGVALVVVTILGGIISSLRTFLFSETTNRIDTRLGAEVIDHLLRIPLNYFDRRPVGELGSRIAELEKIRNFLTGQALTTLLDAAFSLIYIIVMVVYSWLLTLIALGVVPIQILITLIGTPLIRRQIREIAKENATTQSHLVEVLTGIQTVKAQNVERVSRWKWQELYSRYISRTFEKTITGTALQETSQVLQQLSQLLVLWIGASLVLKGQLSLGQLIAFRIISGYVTQPLLRLSTIWQNIQELRVSFERLADIIDTPQEASEKDRSKIPLPSINGLVEFEDVSFSFRPDLPNVLNKINLRIKPGQFVGVVGQSGSGKSTLMKLLPRLYKPNSGTIMIDGYDVDKVELYSLRRQVGIVPQEPLLFAGSVSENIALTDPEATNEEIVEVSKIANAHDFIMELGDGYSTSVGERGAGLSGGQKQRIAIARTLLSNPKLLIMDEATSALDYETERKVCDGLRESCKESTVFFITHRLSTVRNADIIVMLDQGSISEIGTHQELMNIKGRYFALYSQQESS